MAGNTPTHIPIPKNHADFERKAVVLFREILKDPSVKRLGREGQEQFGVDLVGYRDEKISKVVGIQCKKKAPTSTLTETEVRDEVKKALKYLPKLQEYLIITSAKNDTALDQLAQKLSQAQAKKGRKIRIEVWGWGTLEELIDQYPSARQVFDPGWSPSLQKIQTNLDEVAQALRGQSTATQVSASILPFGSMASLPFDAVEQLSRSYDPFSLLFGFEACVEKYRNGEHRALVLGRRFLERLFNDDGWLTQRCEIFSACAIISSSRLRTLAEQNSASLYWFRLAAFANAGVLTNALANIPDTKGFLKWAVERFSGAYTWHAVVDIREEPRWDSEWLSPDSIKAELVGRCVNAVGRLGKKKSPAPWQAIISSAWDRVDPKLSALFPGPLDGFTPTSWVVRREEDLKQVAALLKQRASLKEAPGLALIAYSGGIDASHIDELMRLLEGSNEELSDLKSALGILKCCAYVAATTRSAPLADAVVTRCLRLVTTGSQPGQILLLMLFAMRACGAQEGLADYYRQIEKVATRFSYAAPKGAALDMRVVMEALCERDPRMIAALGRAMQLLVGSSLANDEDREAGGPD